MPNKRESHLLIKLLKQRALLKANYSCCVSTIKWYQADFFRYIPTQAIKYSHLHHWSPNCPQFLGHSIRRRSKRVSKSGSCLGFWAWNQKKHLVGRAVTRSSLKREVWSSNLGLVTQYVGNCSSPVRLLSRVTLTRSWAPQSYCTIRRNTENIMKELSLFCRHDDSNKATSNATSNTKPDLQCHRIGKPLQLSLFLSGWILRRYLKHFQVFKGPRLIVQPTSTVYY